MTARIRLPNRRPNVTRETAWQGHGITVTLGLDPATGAAMEVFANAETGGTLQASLSDACVLISIALQHGIGPDELGKSLLRVPAFIDGEETTAPASPVGVIVEALG